MIIDKLLTFVGTGATADVDLKKEGHIDDEYWFLLKTIKSVAAANKGTWELLTSDDNFTTSKLLASGKIGNGTSAVPADTFVVRMKLPFKPLAKLRVSLEAASGSGSLTMSDVEGYLVSGINLASEIKEFKAV